MRAGAARVTPPEPRYSQSRLELEQPARGRLGFVLPAGQHQRYYKQSVG